MARLSARHDLPVYLTRGTFSGLRGEERAIGNARFIDPYTPFAIGEAEVRPYTVPHDAREPVQYAFSDGATRLGVVTDLGCITQHVVDRLSGCEALLVECNHDLDMLMGGPYPFGLKQRVSGRFGHLSNADAGHLVACLDRSRMRHLIAAHLSQQNNRPELARQALAQAACCGEEEVGVATQDEGFAWRDA